LSSRIFVDVETTGLRPEVHRVVEVGAVLLSGKGDLISEFSSLVNPGEEALRNADPEALRVNRITLEEIRGAPTADQVERVFREWRALHPRALLHAYHKPFDAGFLARAPWSIENGAWGECVLQAAQDQMGFQKRPKLGDAARFFGIPIGPRHRSLPDARLAGAVYIEVLKIRENLDNDECHAILENGF
jgi:DNA polymerase-3 subunit epsilon